VARKAVRRKVARKAIRRRILGEMMGGGGGEGQM
jgi:hypothetical protein